jgi:MarR family 2-MHQ and catechol resistance regulon transcriptional repressor
MIADKSYLKLTTVLFRTMQNVEAVIKKDIKSHHLNTSEFGTLELLYNRGKQPMQSMASRLLMANSSMTYVIDQLEQKGLIYRQQDDVDKRMMMVDLTDQGRLFFDQIFPRHVETLSKMYEKLSKEELDILIESLKKVGYQAKSLQEKKQ